MLQYRIIFIFIVMPFVNPLSVAAEHVEDTWMEPGVWAREQLTLSSTNNVVDTTNKCMCSEKSVPSEDAVAMLYFKKLISLLFDRKTLKYDARSDTHERFLSLTFKTSQLSKLEKLQDPRDIDNLLTEIFVGARNHPFMCKQGQQEATGFKLLVIDIFRDIWKLTQTSEIRFLLVVIVVIIFGWFLHNRYHIPYLALLGGSLFLFGYLHTYLECNRELEVKEMMELIKRNEQSEKRRSQSGFFNFLGSLFSWSSQNDDVQTFKKSTKIKLGFCRPDHVLLIYFNDIFLKYLEVLLEQCTSTLTSLHSSLPFPFNLFAGVFLICLIGYILKLIFKYMLSPAAWSFAHHRNHYIQPPALSQPNTNSHTEDRLSGENLKMLLNAINTVTRNDTPMIVGSGVEEVREAIEPASQMEEINKSVRPDTNMPARQDNNNYSMEQTKVDENEVKLEDIPDDS